MSSLVQNWRTLNIRDLVRFHQTNIRKTNHNTFQPVKAWDIESRDNFNEVAAFSISSFNMLAPIYKRLSSYDLHAKDQKRESQFLDLWKHRASKTMSFIDNQLLCSDSSIISLQEFWLEKEYLNYFSREFIARNFDLFNYKRTGPKYDSLLTIVDRRTFAVKGVKNIALCSLRDRVALLLWLEHRSSGQHLLLVNTHLTFPHDSTESSQQIEEIEFILREMGSFAKNAGIANRALQFVVGDLNESLGGNVDETLQRHHFQSCFRISPPINTRDATDTSPHWHFVSHRNHRQEEVGADHVFIRGGLGQPLDQTRIFVADCRVVPHDRPCHRWDDEFFLSDHRPVSVKVVIGKGKDRTDL
jgi:mRNA deadenylase 3'-5' endonuclease subunit Ccr4